MMIIFLTTLSLATYVLILLFASDKSHYVTFMVLSQIALAIYLTLLFYLKKQSPKFMTGKRFGLLVGMAIVIRLIVAFGASDSTFLSDDIYRYVWEGKMVVHGYNPYVLSPNDMTETSMADSTIYPHINHADLPTIYSPLSQYIFATAWLIGGDSFVGFKVISFLFEILTLFALWVLIRETKSPPWTLAIYLFSPLIIIEFFLSSHLDLLMLPFLITFMISLKRKGAIAAGICLALACLVKLTSLIFLPVPLIYFAGRNRWRFLASFLIVAIFLYLPFLKEAGSELFGSLWTYLRHWRYNGSVYQLLSIPLGFDTARSVCGALMITATVAIALRKSAAQPLTAMFWIAGVYVILTPSLFSWYVTLLLPFLVIFRQPAFLVLTGTVMLSYHVFIAYFQGHGWHELWYMTCLEYAPFYGLLIFGLIERNRDTMIEAA